MTRRILFVIGGDARTCEECGWLDNGNDRCWLFAEGTDEGRPSDPRGLDRDAEGARLRLDECLDAEREVAALQKGGR